MRKLMILLVAFLLPLSALEMSADEKGTIRPIPLRKVEKKNLNRSLFQENIMTVYYGMLSSIQTTVTSDLGQIEMTVSNLSTGEAWSDTFDSGVIMQTLLPISGTPGFYEIEYITESGDVFAGEFLIE
jgi:hypothetical protein